jgi:hypothetical protein
MFALKEHVVVFNFQVFQVYQSMLQVFYINVTKVNRDDAYITIVVHVLPPSINRHHLSKFQISRNRHHFSFSSHCSLGLRTDNALYALRNESDAAFPLYPYTATYPPLPIDLKYSASCCRRSTRSTTLPWHRSTPVPSLLPCRVVAAVPMDRHDAVVSSLVWRIWRGRQWSCSIPVVDWSWILECY